MREITLGQYYPAESPLHRLDPRTKILMVIVYMVTVFFVDTFVGYGVILLAVIIAIAMSRVPLRLVLKSLKPILFLIIFTAVLNLLFYSGKPEDLLWGWTWGWIKLRIYKMGLITAGKMAVRLLLLVIGPSLLTLTTTPVRLTDGIESLMAPLKIVRFPVHEFAIIMSIALRLIPTLIEETDKIILAQKARCADFDSGNLIKKAKAMLPILIPLFVSSFRRADELAYAMDSRCYRGSKGRTKMRVLRFRAGDFIALTAILALTFATLVLRYNFFDFGFISYIRGIWYA